jgi:hypothetical protein
MWIIPPMTKWIRHARFGKRPSEALRSLTEQFLDLCGQAVPLLGENAPCEFVKQPFGKLGFPHLGDQRPDEGIDDFFQRNRLAGPLSFERFKPRQTFLAHGNHVAHHHQTEQRLTTSEMVIDRCDVGLGDLGDVPHGNRLKTFLGK